jgi:hypothetical protein
VIALLLALQTPDADVLNLNDGQYILRHTDKRSLSIDSKSSAIKIDAAGKPLELMGGAQGLTLRGQTANAILTKLPDGTYRLDSADIDGAAHVIVDSRTADEYLTAHGQKPTGGDQSWSELTSAGLLLQSSNGQQTVSSATPIDLSDRRSNRNSSEQGVLTGMRCLITLGVDPVDGRERVIAGTVEGNVHYHVIQTQLHPDKAPTVTEYDVKTDRLVLDFTKPEGTVKAMGHVHWTQMGGGVPFASDDDLAVLKTDPNRQIQSITGTGEPTRTVVPLEQKSPAPVPKKRKHKK